MRRVWAICAICALAVGIAALALTGSSDGLRNVTANKAQYGSPTPPAPPPPPVVPPANPPPPPTALEPAVQNINVQGISVLPTNKKCLSRRNFGIRLRSPRRGEKLIEGRVFVNGKQVRVVKGERLRSMVNLKGLPKGRYVVRITVKTNKRHSFAGTRRYRTCTKKLKGGIPKI
jgi:hypothetical protein